MTDEYDRRKLMVECALLAEKLRAMMPMLDGVNTESHRAALQFAVDVLREFIPACKDVPR